MLNEKTVSKECSPLEVSRVFRSNYQKEKTLTAEIRQEIKTSTLYPNNTVCNNKQGNIYDVKDFDIEALEPFVATEKRVAWINVPEHLSADDVQRDLGKFEGACIYKVLSNEPILTNSQEAAIEDDSNDVSIESYCDRQAIRYPESHEKAGELVLDSNKKVQYRVTYFSPTFVEDQDLRNDKPENSIISSSILDELNDMPF